MTDLEFTFEDLQMLCLKKGWVPGHSIESIAKELNAILREKGVIQLAQWALEAREALRGWNDVLEQLEDQNCLLPGEIDGFSERVFAVLAKFPQEGGGSEFRRQTERD